MNLKAVSLAFVALFLCTMIFIAPASDAANVNTVSSNNVSLTLIEDSITISTSEDTEIAAHIHNGNPIAVTVAISEKSGSLIKVSTASDVISVPSGSTVDIICYFSADDSTDIGKYDAVISMSVMDGINPVSVAEMTVQTEVISHYSDGNQYNRFFGIFENNLGSPFNQPWFTTLVTFIAWIIISLAVGAILYGVIRTIFKFCKLDGSDISMTTFYWMSICVLLQGIINSLWVWGVESSTMESIEKIIAVIYVPLIALVAWDVYRTFVYNALLKSEQKGLSSVDTSLAPLFNFIGRLFIIVTAIVVILTELNVDIAAIIAAAGIAGLGISLGAKPMISQFLAGIVLMVVRPFKQGDAVRIGSSDVRIVKKVTVLQTEFVGDGTKEHIYYSNSKVAGAKITNLTGSSRVFCKTMVFNVPFDVDMESAKSLAEQAASEDSKVITDGSYPLPKVIFHEYKDRSMIKMRLDIYVRDYNDAGSTAGRVREAILKRFYENGIEMPMSAYEITVVDFKGDVNES